MSVYQRQIYDLYIKIRGTRTFCTIKYEFYGVMNKDDDHGAN